ncbi:hypothetical protein [Jiangella endophytica]|uniref:hypothetical protein n=1 Tax=Jiangella endophytica TaxID=1623398 RepID=UPI000E34693D|nr:hypothetical protein [Jiangella endophytica]
MARGTRAGPAWPGVALVLVTAVASAGVASAVWAVREDRAQWAVSDPAEQIAVVAEACEQWAVAEPQPDDTGLDDDEDRCAALAGWLSDSLTRTGRSPWMSWGEPQRLLATCRGWLAETSSSDTTTWCDDFVGWMSGHVGEWSGSTGRHDWDGWLRSGPLVGP